MAHTVLLIGGNSGIGWETAKLLHARGDKVLAAARDAGPLKDLGIPVQAFDALDPQPVEVPPVLDGFIYFPGTINLKPFHRLKEADFLHDYRVNVLGAVSALQSALPSLKAAPSASVVLFSTVAVARGMSFHASVASAKAAVEGLAISLAAELAPAIRVNVIAPSLTDTPLAENLLGSEAKKEAASARHPLRQIGHPQDVAELAAFLLSDASRFLTGQIFRPDGGLSSIHMF